MAEMTILKRMAQTTRATSPVDPGLRPFAGAAARAAEAVLGLPLAVTGLRTTAVTLADLPEFIEERALIALIEAPGERLGLAILSGGLVAAIIEMLTAGRLAPGEPGARRPTRTDAALSSGLIERILGETDAAAGDGDAPWTEWEPGFHYASSVEDARLLPLILDDTRYRLLSAGLTLGGQGERRVSLSFVLPERRLPGRAAATAPNDGANWQQGLQGAVMGAEAEVVAVLARVTRPLAEVVALRPGALIPLPDDALGNLRIEGADKCLLSRARLGQYRGYLAVRLTAGPETTVATFTPAELPVAEPRLAGAAAPVQRVAGG